ncbi:non-hydrolyzing UDP-N-acetylglucosamine 2-epimerase [Laspinema olomoucense]|uniref:UDP-N-acetylglucosamine 2-epimerase (Non-hydrolyzing) n=1 Tax=Laspinema olomoucense D3b TaxID=2953688 RepID=A0ABT2N1D4_9CYAN|nr:UDP-N-acetylglucosamine 2-epimerase (non-hydrolyzing) [Laspinema sp. D3b]MCT7976492.1 UDP-N-acetylglucosamine 2-epimerase (non-hydrolyzing) [Laspinema sp. D3b]
MLKIATVVGARPQFIKAATVSRVLRSTPDITEILVHTGQHYDANMSEVFFQELEIPPPDYHLGIGSGTHGAQTGRMLEAIEGVLLEEKPDWVLVYGDTNSTLAGALAAVKLHIPVAHIEAGLRSFNWQMPEEINRVLTDRASNLLFAPTEVAVENLRREGIHQGTIHLVGDVMYDAALYYGSKAAIYSFILKHLNLRSKGYILATIHRAENTDYSANIQAIFRGLMQVAAEIPVLLPLHPRTRKALEQNNLMIPVSNCLQIIEPVGYLDMVMLEKNARLIVTDSGGVQKEAFFYRVPCVILREETEWVELVQSRWNRLVPPKSDIVVRCEVFNSLTLPDGDLNSRTVYGTGQAAKQIVKILK